MCILYALVSSHLKKRRTPYQVPGQDFFQLCQSSSPSSTQYFWEEERSLNGTSSGIFLFFAYLTRSSWHSLKLAVCQGRMLPCLSDRFSFGTTRPKSTPIMRPKPRQLSHAPIGELKEKAAGVGSEYWMSQSAQCRLDEKRCTLSEPSSYTF